MIVLACAAMAYSGVVPAAFPLAVAPFASSYTAHTANHAIATPVVAPAVARVAAPLVAPAPLAYSPYVAKFSAPVVASAPLAYSSPYFAPSVYSSPYVAAPAVYPYAAGSVIAVRR